MTPELMNQQCDTKCNCRKVCKADVASSYCIKLRDAGLCVAKNYMQQKCDTTCNCGSADGTSLALL